MTTETTPSKQVNQTPPPPPSVIPPLSPLTNPEQAASSLENLKMQASPVKKILFQPIGKENIAEDVSIVDELVKKPDDEIVKKEEKPAVAPTIKLEEADEPILRENPHRFVLFPIKYHEVCNARRAQSL